MHRVLIVDDEPIIVRGLLSVLGDSGLEVDLYSAGSGEDALGILQETRMDIVISDVHMPGMDGLQLMNHIRKEWPSCRVIFLSGHSEFDAIYQAVQGEAVTFLLKTEGFDKIVSTLQETIREIEQAQCYLETQAKLENQQAVTRQLLLREALSAFVTGMDEDFQRTGMAVEGMEIRLDESILPLYAYMESDTSVATMEGFHHQLLLADRLLRRQLAHYPVRIAFWNHHRDLLWMIQPTAGLPMHRCMLYVRENLDLIQHAVQNEAKMTLAFALHTAAVQPRELSGVYQMLRQRICQGVGIPGMIALQGQVERSAGVVSLITDSMLTRLQEAMEHLNRQEFMTMLIKTTDALRINSPMNDPYGAEAFLSLSRLFLAYINRWKLHGNVQFPGGLRGLTTLSGFSSWDQVADAFLELGQMLFRVSANDQGSRSQSIVLQIKEHIAQNLHQPEELSLSRIAEITFFNPTYLSRLFHQVTGETISDYISSARIQKANQLLRNPSMRINDVGEAVGFSSSANFSRFYRKMMNCTPQEYRDSIAQHALRRTK